MSWFCRKICWLFLETTDAGLVIQIKQTKNGDFQDLCNLCNVPQMQKVLQTYPSLCEKCLYTSKICAMLLKCRKFSLLKVKVQTSPALGVPPKMFSKWNVFLSYRCYWCCPGWKCIATFSPVDLEIEKSARWLRSPIQKQNSNVDSKIFVSPNQRFGKIFHTVFVKEEPSIFSKEGPDTLTDWKTLCHLWGRNQVGLLFVLSMNILEPVGAFKQLSHIACDKDFCQVTAFWRWVCCVIHSDGLDLLSRSTQLCTSQNCPTTQH